ncbi:MAG TPA: M6 family metalloprotease domain-containing protein [Gemmatimonadales bacterium]|nr:M6 family metalloprotease domain-containing protein [Gemmatimonadales bacterium]
MVSYVVRYLGVAALLCAIVPPDAVAQGRRHPRWEIPGFDFRKDGVLRVRARKVREARARLLSAGRFDALNAPVARVNQGGPQPSPTSATTLTGVLKVPAILLRFKDSPAPAFIPADYDAVLFASTPPPGRPYTYRSFYRELSDSVFDIQGSTLPQVNLDSNEVWYTGGTSSICAGANPFGSMNCNGLFSTAAQSRMHGGLDSALAKLDATIDFSQYADSTGFVPLVLFLHQAMGGECGPFNAPENHLWAHRWALSTFTTNDNDPFHAGQKVKISDYILQSSLGGSSSCNTSQIMPIGTIAHETGHGFGLPDLYDTGGQTEGIGQWGLMSSGSFTSPNSPSRMEAWSLNELGWVTLTPLTTTGTYSFDAAPLSDIAYYVRVQGTNTRGEYYLLENRQRQQSDSALIRIHCIWSGNPPGCGGGLLIWHVDSTKLLQGAFSNTVNVGSIHGLAVVQADAFRNLDASTAGTRCDVGAVVNGCSDRGDAGDVYPGTAGNTAMVFRTNPAALKNLDGSFAGFAVDSIRQLVTDRTMSFRVRFGALTVVRASDTTATIQFAGTTYNVYRDMLENGQGYTVSFTDPQLSANGRTRFHFVSWSDGGAITHTYTGHLAGETLTANVSRDVKLIATVQGQGTIEADTAGIDLAGGTFIPAGRTVTLTASPDPGVTFGGWCGDTVTTNTVVALPMQRPYTVLANFGALVLSAPAARPNGVMGASYTDALESSGGGCTKSWAVTGGALPQGLTLGSQTGVVSGFPRQTGDFTYTVTVTSGAQSQSKTFTFSVTAPTLATADVTAQLLGPTAPLNADQVRYLDYLGNNNGGFDIGDFLAWVKATGAPLSAAALQRKGGPR